ncbi:hypothetical protein ACFVGM_09200 [Kitasatospora purpeofusca]|uniref:hypothetical protein n=1 Tax=Kitasatospora purpeofusca TaxID=67352 RepID=UPI003679E576
MSDRRIYRIAVSAYNSAHSCFPPAWFVYDIRAFDRDHAIEQLPKRHSGPKGVLYLSPDNFGRRFEQPYFGERRLSAWYGEWQVMEIELRRSLGGRQGASQARRPLVWLGKTNVLLVETGIYEKEKTA